jgi:hypothetical protein
MARLTSRRAPRIIQFAVAHFAASEPCSCGKPHKCCADLKACGSFDHRGARLASVRVLHGKSIPIMLSCETSFTRLTILFQTRGCPKSQDSDESVSKMAESPPRRLHALATSPTPPKRLMSSFPSNVWRRSCTVLSQAVAGRTQRGCISCSFA